MFDPSPKDAFKLIRGRRNCFLLRSFHSILSFLPEALWCCSFQSSSWRERSNGIVGKPTTKRISLIWSYGIYLKYMRWQPATHGKRIGLIWTRRRETYFTERIIEEIGSFISTISSLFFSLLVFLQLRSSICYKRAPSRSCFPSFIPFHSYFCSGGIVMLLSSTHLLVLSRSC